MDNLESIFQDIRRQIEEEFANIPFSINRERQENIRNLNPSDDTTSRDIINIINDYTSLYRQHQETFSVFNLNMLSLILLLRDFHERRRSEETRQRIDELINREQLEVRGRNIQREPRIPEINPLIPPVIASPRSPIIESLTPSFSTSPRISPVQNPNRNTAFGRRESNLTSMRPPSLRQNPRLVQRRHTLFNVSDLSRNTRTTRPFFSPRVPAQRDGRFFFGGLGPELRDVVVRPTNQEIQNAITRFTYEPSLTLLNRRCPITMEDFEEGDRLIQLIPCGHAFKDEPIINWFQEHVRCPVCRYDIRDYTPRNNEESSSSDADTPRPSNRSTPPLNTTNDSRLNNSLSGITPSSSSSSLQPSSPLNINPMERVESYYSEDSTYSDHFENIDQLMNENFMQDISNGVGQILDNLITDMSNTALPPLSYSLSVPIVYHGFFDPSNNQTYNNLQFHSP
tara:strand:+ start:357 stop:1721 length:1365 start_codon:yes stop_codon:yes gene_type:complete